MLIVPSIKFYCGNDDEVHNDLDSAMIESLSPFFFREQIRS